VTRGRFTSASFLPEDVGKTVRLVAPWYRRLWRWFLYVVFRRPKPNLGSYTITKIVDQTSIEIERD
jgi:hypothetical protein